MRTLLIVSSSEDPCTDMVIETLQNRRVDFVRLDTDLFNGEIGVTLDLDSRGKFDGCFHFSRRDLPFDDIGLVWYRRIADPVVDPCLADEPALFEWASEEAEWSLYTALTLLPARCVNPFIPYDRISENKWIQMRAATEHGFAVPTSRLTNSRPNIETFWDCAAGQIVFKKVRRGLAQLKDGRRILLHTSRVAPEQWTPESLDRMRFYPMFLQEDVPKAYDVRAVVVGDKVFAFAIHSQDVPMARTDYRTAFVFQQELVHEWIQLGEPVDSRLVRFVKSFGHEFGVIDLVRTPADQLVFLEDNPNGQWAWLETKTGAPIAAATADHLIALCSGIR